MDVEGKGKVTRQIENGDKEVDVCREFGLVNCTIERICKNGTKTVDVFEQNGWRIKRVLKV